MRSLLPLLLLAACEADPELCAGGDPTLAIGVGENTFRATSPGEEVTPVLGAQGLWHVWTALAIGGLTLPADGNLVAHLEATIDGELTGEDLPYLDLRCDPSDGLLKTWGIAFTVGGSTYYDPSDAYGKEVVVDASIVLPGGESWTDQATWTIGSL